MLLSLYLLSGIVAYATFGFQVEHMKEMLFSGSDDKSLIGKNARRMMMHLSIPIGDDLQQTLSLFEKVQYAFVFMTLCL